MKKILITLVILFAWQSQAQESRLQAFGEVTAFNFQQFQYTLDANYRISDRTSVSSWNTVTSGRTEQQGFNYSVFSALFNMKGKDFNQTLSVGYGVMNQFSFTDRALIVKLRMRLL